MLFKKKGATRIAGSGLKPLLTLKAMQARRRKRTERELAFHREDDVIAGLIARGGI